MRILQKNSIGDKFVIKRDYYFNKLISKMNNGLIKVITGIKRCGKSFLTFLYFWK